MTSPESVLDAFTAAYIAAVYFTETGPDSEIESNVPLHPKTLEKIKDDCQRFQRENYHLLQQTYQFIGYNASQAGHDFWLTRNHHGAGFWDRKALNFAGIGDELTKKAQRYSELSASFSDEGLILE